MGILGFAFRVGDLEFRVADLGFRAWGLGLGMFRA